VSRSGRHYRNECGAIFDTAAFALVVVKLQPELQL
jgi:hypothetical protein